MASTFPSRTVTLHQPLHTGLHTVDDDSAGYNNYSKAFSEITAYDNNSSSRFPVDPSTPRRPSPTPASAPTSAPSTLTKAPSSTSQIEAFGTKFLNVISESVRSPPAVVAGLSRTKSLHARARSLASFVPSLTSSLVQEQDGTSTEPRKPRAFGPLFGTSSLRRPNTAYADEVEAQEQQPQDFYPYIMEYKSTLTGGDRPSASASASAESTSSHTPRPTTAASTKKFSWFGGGSKQQAAQSIATLQAYAANGDAELFQPAASLLLPNGNLDPEDPSSFTSLLKNAEALITKLQIAYTQQESALKIARQEREAAVEEAEEADTRARHLKLQLDEMGKQATEQEASIKAMTHELAEERLKHVQDNERWERPQRRQPADDEHTPKRSSYRNSAASSNSMSSMASDSGFESDSYAETETDASTVSRPMTPVYEERPWEMSTKENMRPLSRGSLQDRICQVDVGVWTWMREEKGRLEKRVMELEGVVDGCLDLVA